MSYTTSHQLSTHTTRRLSATLHKPVTLCLTIMHSSKLAQPNPQRMGDVCVRTGIKMRASLMSAVFRKTFALSSVRKPVMK